MALPLANRVKGTVQRGINPNITFQDALGARIVQQQQRQGGQLPRMVRSFNQRNTQHPLSQTTSYNQQRYGSLSSTNPYNHGSQSQSRPTHSGFTPHRGSQQYGITNNRYKYDPYGYPYGQQQHIHQQYQSNTINQRHNQQNRSSRSQLSPIVRSGYGNNNQNHNNNNNNNNQNINIFNNNNNRNSNNNNNNNNNINNSNTNRNTNKRRKKQNPESKRKQILNPITTAIIVHQKNKNKNKNKTNKTNKKKINSPLNLICTN